MPTAILLLLSAAIMMCTLAFQTIIIKGLERGWQIFDQQPLAEIFCEASLPSLLHAPVVDSLPAPQLHPQLQTWSEEHTDPLCLPPPSDHHGRGRHQITSSALCALLSFSSLDPAPLNMEIPCD